MTPQKKTPPAGRAGGAEQTAIPIKNSATYFAAFKRWMQYCDADLWACLIAAFAAMVLPLVVEVLK